jgi:hypothetical protein
MNSLGFPTTTEQALKHHQKQWLLSKPINNYERNTMENRKDNDTITKARLNLQRMESFETIPFSTYDYKGCIDCFGHKTPKIDILF